MHAPAVAAAAAAAAAAPVVAPDFESAAAADVVAASAADDGDAASGDERQYTHGTCQRHGLTPVMSMGSPARPSLDRKKTSGCHSAQRRCAHRQSVVRFIAPVLCGQSAHDTPPPPPPPSSVSADADVET